MYQEMFKPQMMEKAFHFNKLTFQTMFQAATAVQDQTEQVANIYLSGMGFVPEPYKNMYKAGMDLLKKERENYRKLMEDNFKTMEQIFSATSSAAAGAFSEKPAKAGEEKSSSSEKQSKSKSSSS